MKGLNFKCEGNAIEIHIYGDIGDNFWEKWEKECLGEERDENQVQNLDELTALLKKNSNAATIDIYINSNGGDVFDGVAMMNVLKRHPAYKRVHIDGFACSIASVIAMCGNQIIMPKSSMMMVHNPWTVAVGNSKELRKIADDLDKINETIKNAYRSKMKIDDEKLVELMDNESYLTADECLEYGLCTKVVEDNENTEENVNEALDKVTNLFQNKLETLNKIHSCIKDIEQNDVEVEEVEEKAEEVEETIESVETAEVDSIETDETIENKDEAQKEVDNIKENALLAFFNLKQEDK